MNTVINCYGQNKENKWLLLVWAPPAPTRWCCVPRVFFFYLLLGALVCRVKRGRIWQTRYMYFRREALSILGCWGSSQRLSFYERSTASCLRPRATFCRTDLFRIMLLGTVCVLNFIICKNASRSNIIVYLNRSVPHMVNYAKRIRVKYMRNTLFPFFIFFLKRYINK